MDDATEQGLYMFEFVFRTMGDGLIVANSKRLVTHMNPAAASMLTTAPEAAIGKYAEQAFAHNPALVNLFTRTGEQQLDVRLPRRRLAQGTATTVTSGERFVLLHDITEQRDLETRRESLSTTIAHDLRNPLSAIQGFADLIERFGPLNEKQLRFVTRIQQTAIKLQESLRPLVDLAWIEAGMPLRHVPIRLDEPIFSAVETVHDLARDHRIGIATSIQNPLPVIMGDPQRLGLVIVQLLQNAILYSSPEHNVVIHAWGDETELYCAVADQGIGIADDELEQIFDRMYRAPQEKVREINGAGLGLTIAKTIIRRHGGDIWATSNVGEGSTLTFVLPVVRL